MGNIGRPKKYEDSKLGYKMKKDEYKKTEKYKKNNKEYQKKYYSKTVDSDNRCSRWTIKDEQMVLDHSIPDSELSKIIGRSVKAIQMKRTHLKKK